MAETNFSSVTQWRKRRQRQGFVRVEVQVRKEDAALIRDVAKALIDPDRESETRDILREKISSPSHGGLKALLSSAPLEGVNLVRQSDFGRSDSL